MYWDLIIQKYLPPQDLLHPDKLPVASINRKHICCYQTPSKYGRCCSNHRQAHGHNHSTQGTNTCPAERGPSCCCSPTSRCWLGANDLINYLTKQGSAIFKQGCKALGNKALADGFAMTPDQTVIFIEAFHRHATMMGWNQGTRQITTFANSARCQVNIIKSNGKINKATLKSACERFCKPEEANS
jgi:hypothetical protein